MQIKKKITKLKPDEESLFKAIEEGNLTAIQNLIDEGVNLEIPYPKHGTPLIYAIHFGRVKVVQVLLKNKVDIHKYHSVQKLSQKFEWTPLHYAFMLYYSHWEQQHTQHDDILEIIIHLLKAGADVNNLIKSEQEDMPLLVMCMWTRRFDVAVILLEYGSNINPNVTKEVGGIKCSLIDLLINILLCNISLHADHCLAEGKKINILDNKDEYDLMFYCMILLIRLGAKGTKELAQEGIQ
jgi:ankyrin repeat protein